MFNTRNRSGISAHPCVILYLLNSYTLFSCILRKIIISTSPWQPGSKNRKDCPILAIIYQTIKGCYRKLFFEHSGLNQTRVYSNKFINSACLCKGWTFIFFKGGEIMKLRFLTFYFAIACFAVLFQYETTTCQCN